MDCPKCGNKAGWSGPKFVALFDTRARTFGPIEWLEYSCIECGYTRQESCKDANTTIVVEK